MAIATSLENFLLSQQIDYHLLKHRPTPNLLDTARAATLSPTAVARAVLLRDGAQRHWIVLIPSDRLPDLERITDLVGARVEPCTLPQGSTLFADCHPGVTPPFGQPYHLATLVDRALLEPRVLYVEDGDPTELIRLDQTQFRRLIRDSQVTDLSSYRPH